MATAYSRRQIGGLGLGALSSVVVASASAKARGAGGTPSAPVAPMTSDAFHALAEKVSNWGRWGATDELGAMNLLTPERARAALRSVVHGRTVACGKPVPALQTHGGASGDLKLTIAGQDEFTAVNDRLTLDLHGYGSATHLDALGHIYYRGRGYNGRPFPGVEGDRVAYAGIETAAGGIVGRGVLLDLAGALNKPWLAHDDVIDPAQLREILVRQRIRLRPGDILFVRMGWPPAGAPAGTGGLAIACAELIRDAQPSIIVSDGGMEIARPQVEGIRIPWHILTIAMMGVRLVDSADLDRLAATVRELRATQFAVTIAPIEFTGGTASPVNPLCLF